ncbi:MAG: hypothetical protein K8S99_17755 [Planctomycetes bacterium]|nr:hypothetical protein [Planctomycetota bacterium]
MRAQGVQDRDGEYPLFGHPILDEAFVDVPSDPACWSVYKSSGWARFDKDTMEEQARADLRAWILAEARRGGWDRQADLVAQESLRELIRSVYGDTAMVVEICWR